MERIALGGDGWRLERERSALGESAVAASLCRRTHYNAPRQIAVQSNATKWLLLLALLDLLVLCAGCRTTYRPTGTAPAKPAVSSLFDGLPPEIYRAWAAYVCAEPGEPRQQAAEQLLRILSQWGVGSPADPGLHARVELMSAVASAQARLDQETNACDRVPAAEEVIRLLKVGLDLPGWQSGELAQLKARFDEVHRLRDQALMEMRAEESYASVKNRENYARAIEALTDLAALCRRFAAADYYTVTDRDKWSRSARNFDQLRDQYVHEFEVALGALHQALEQAQKIFVNTAAATDCRTAREIWNAQDNKTFNWWVLGRFRDDPREFAKAMVLLDRVLEDARVDYLIRTGAASQRVGCSDRLGRQGRAIYNQMGSLAGYDTLTQFPQATAEELRNAAEVEWRKAAQPAPALRSPEEGPRRDLGPATLGAVNQ